MKNYNKEYFSVDLMCLLVRLYNIAVLLFKILPFVYYMVKGPLNIKCLGDVGHNRWAV